MYHQATARFIAVLTLLALSARALLTAADLPAGPNPSVPSGGSAPGDYPNFTVTAANWVMDASAVTDFSSNLRDEVTMNLAGQGPLPWSLTEFGQGRYAPRLNVADPQAAATKLGVLPFDLIIDGTAYHWENDIDPWAPNGAAWRPSPTKGILLGTVRKNGQEWNDNEGPFHGVLSTNIEMSGGEGYSLEDGSFGAGDADIAIGKAGSDLQGSLDTSVAWFPYDQGWIGGHVATADFVPGEWFKDGYHHPDLPADPGELITWTRELGFIIPPVTVRIPNVNARTDGMLFTMSLNDSTANTRITAADPNADGTGWEVMIRSDNQTDHEFGEEVGLQFGFLYVPYDAVNLIGGHIRGSDANVINGRGSFTVQRRSTGQYELAIPTKQAGDGMLILGAAGRLRNSASVVGRNFLSYEPEGADKFIIESRYFQGEDNTPLEDTDFYFAWVDFATPLAPPGFESAIDPPTITSHPQSVNIELGAGTTFSVAATGTEPFIYQWSKDGVPITGATEPSYSITDADLADAGDYQVQVTNAGGQATSNTATLRILAAPAITLQPQSQDVPVGNTVTFEVAASGTPPLRYQWQKDGFDIPGATNARLTLSNIGIVDAGQYRARVVNDVSEAVSVTARLTVQAIAAPPQITQHPRNQSVDAGQNVAFTVVATGTPPLSYQWQFNEQNLAGATSMTLNLSAVQTSNAGRYRAIVTDSIGSSTSNTATLMVTMPPPQITPPTIIQQPQAVSLETGDALRLQVLATGDQLTYQWSRDGQNIAGATQSVFEIASVPLGAAGSYVVRISNPAGSVTTNPARVTVSEPPPPAGNTLQIVSQPASQTVAPGDTVTFTVTAQGTPPLTYQWQLGNFNIPGARNASFSIANVQTIDEGAYRVVVSDSTGSLTSNNAVLTVSVAPIITQQPATQTITAGDSVTFSVQAQGQAPLSYQWQYNGINIPGARGQSFSISGVQSADQGSYSVIVTDSAGSTTSDAAILTVTDRPTSNLVIQRISLTGNSLLIEWNGGPGIVLQAKANLSDPVWQDVPGTDGQSRVQQLALGLSAYFRLIQR